MDNELTGVAIVGMAGRFPGARNLDEFWHGRCNWGRTDLYGPTLEKPTVLAQVPEEDPKSPPPIGTPTDPDPSDPALPRAGVGPEPCPIRRLFPPKARREDAGARLVEVRTPLVQ